MRKVFSSLLILALVIGCIGPASFAKVQAADVKMTVNGTEYTSFSDGWNATYSAGEATVVLYDDWCANGGDFGSGKGFSRGRIYAADSVEITLDLNGHTIDRGMKSTSSRGQVFYLQDYAELTICDNSEGHTGKITGADAEEGGAFYVCDSSKLNLEDVTVSGNKAEEYGGAIYLEDRTRVNLRGATVVENNESGYCGGAIYARDKASVGGGGTAIVRNNTAEYGGGIYVDDSAYIWFGDDSSIVENHSTVDGGGAYLYWYGKAILTENAEISRNRADVDGGGIYVDKDTRLQMAHQSAIKDNVAGNNGGGICTSVNDGFLTGSTTEVNLSSGYVTGNHAKVAGGISYYSTKGYFQIRNVVVSGNTADETAGGVYTWSSPCPVAVGGSTYITGNNIVKNNLEIPSNLVAENFTTNGTSIEEGALIGLTKSNLTSDARQNIFISNETYYLNEGDEKYFVYDDSNYAIEEEIGAEGHLNLYLIDTNSSEIDTVFNGIVLEEQLNYDLGRPLYGDIEEDIYEMLPKSTMISLLVGQNDVEKLVTANINWSDIAYPVGEPVCTVVGEVEIADHVQNPDDLNTVITATINYEANAAAIGDVTYELIQTAIAKAKNGDTIKLLCDNVVYTLTIPEGKEITIDLAGKKLITNGDFAIENYGNLTIVDSSKGGMISSAGIKNYGTLTVNSGTYESAGYAFENYDGATMVVNDAIVNAPGAVKNTNKATLIVNGGKFSAKSDTESTIYAYASTVTINGGEFRRDGKSSIIYIEGTATNATITDGEFVSTSGGSIIDAKTLPKLSISGGNFDGAIDAYEDLKGAISGGTFVAEAAGFVKKNVASGYLYAANTEENEYTVLENVYFTYLGAGLKYAGASSDSAKIRYGYDFADDFDLAASKWHWKCGLDKNSLVNATGENYDAKNVTNLVISGISPTYYGHVIYSQLVFDVTIDGKTYTVEDAIRGNYVNYIANSILYNQAESDAVKRYAAQLMREYENFLGQ